MTDFSKSNSALVEFLSSYGIETPMQSASDYVYDPQIKNVSTLLADIITRSENGTIVDVGCGNGILLRRLLDLDCFSSGKWIYFAAGSNEDIDEVMKIAIDRKIHRRIDIRSLDEFYENDIDREEFKPPHLYFVRNVLHELDIPQTTILFEFLRRNLTDNDYCIIQDLQVFPVSERGMACWQPQFLTQSLTEIGFTCTPVEEPTSKGNRWFTILLKAAYSAANNPNNISDNVYQAKVNQFNYWNQLGWLLPDDGISRELILAKLDFDLQCASLRNQLESHNPSAYGPLPQSQQSMIAKKLFGKFLNGYDVNFINTLNTLSKPESFRDRANHQDWLEEFLRDDTVITTIYGGHHTGKTILASFRPESLTA